MLSTTLFVVGIISCQVAAAQDAKLFYLERIDGSVENVTEKQNELFSKVNGKSMAAFNSSIVWILIAVLGGNRGSYFYK